MGGQAGCNDPDCVVNTLLTLMARAEKPVLDALAQDGNDQNGGGWRVGRRLEPPLLPPLGDPPVTPPAAAPPPSSPPSASPNFARTLVVYAYYETVESKLNARLFLKHALTAPCQGVDFVFVLNGPYSVHFPTKRSNVWVVERDNRWYDVGAWRDGLGFMWHDDATARRYAHYILMNSSVRGPFLPKYVTDIKPSARACGSMGSTDATSSAGLVGPTAAVKTNFDWTTIFTEPVRGKVRLSGPVLACMGDTTAIASAGTDRSGPHREGAGGIHGQESQGQEGLAVLQTSLICTDARGVLEYVVPRLNSAVDAMALFPNDTRRQKDVAIWLFEMALSSAVLSNGGRLHSLLLALEQPRSRPLHFWGKAEGGGVEGGGRDGSDLAEGLPEDVASGCTRELQAYSSHGGDMQFPGEYDGVSVSPLEVVFIKTNRGLNPANLAAHTRWLGLPVPGEFEFEKKKEEAREVIEEKEDGPKLRELREEKSAGPLSNTTTGCPRSESPGAKVTLYVSVIATPARRELRDATRSTWCMSAARAVAESGGQLAITVEFVVGGGSYDGVDQLQEEATRYGDMHLVPGLADGVQSVIAKVVASAVRAHASPAAPPTHWLRTDDDTWVNIEGLAKVQIGMCYNYYHMLPRYDYYRLLSLGYT